MAVEKDSNINTCAFHPFIPGQCNRPALKHTDDDVYDGEKGDGDQEHVGQLPQKVETRGSEDAQIEDQEGNFGHSDNDIIGDFSGIEKFERASKTGRVGEVVNMITQSKLRLEAEIDSIENYGPK